MTDTQYVSLLQQKAISYIEQIRLQGSELLRNPLVPRVALAFLSLKLIAWTHHALNNYSLNNWVKCRSWDSTQELVLVTGGSSGIGKEIVSGLASKGVRVILLDIQKPSFSLASNVAFYHADVNSSESIRAVADKIRADHGHPTVLINNAGVGNDGTILEKSEARIRQTFEINTISHFLMIKEFLPSMIKQNHGHIVTIASMASFMSLGGMVDYSCSKASALAFHEGLSQELSHWYNARAVRTSIFHPSWVRTPMIQVLTSAGNRFKQPILSPEVVAEAVIKQILTQKSGQIILPGYQVMFTFVRSLPTWIQQGIRGLAGKSLKSIADGHHQAAKGTVSI